jgi:hypothetical protein
MRRDLFQGRRLSRSSFLCSTFEGLRSSREDVRGFTAWSESQIKKHLSRLEELEYPVVHHRGRAELPCKSWCSSGGRCGKASDGGVEPAGAE